MQTTELRMIELNRLIDESRAPLLNPLGFHALSSRAVPLHRGSQSGPRAN